MRSALRRLSWIVLAVTLVMVAAFNYTNIEEAYGSGPPYYGPSTNMDKWIEPLPVMAAVDVATALLVATLIYMLLRKHRKKAR